MKNSMSFSIAGLTLACAAGTANADIAGPPYALGGSAQYHQTSPPIHFSSFFDVFVELDLTFSGPVHLPPPPGPPSFGQCDGTTTSSLALNGLPPGQPVWQTVHSSFFDVFTEVSVDGSTRHYDTEMLQLDMSGFMPGMGPIWIRESPTLQSTGHYSVTTLPQGGFHIDSFFDIFTELSVDGGQTWTPGDGPARMELGPVTPAPGAACLLALSGAFAGRRRRH